MKTLTFVTAAAWLAGGALAFAQSTTLPSKKPAEMPAVEQTKVDTPTFIKTVPGANEFEIQSSQLALQKGVKGDVRTFAREMIKDHTEAGKEFKAALSQSETTSATQASGPTLPPKEQGQLDQLKGLSGDAFRKQYIEMQAGAHREAVALFQAYSQSGDDPALKEFAKKTLPVLKMHERHVKQLQAAHQG
jgi:putative membrane protein